MKTKLRFFAKSVILFRMLNQSLVSGIILVLLPLLGFPSGWKTYIYVTVGLLLVARFVYEKRSFFEKFFGQKPNISVESSSDPNNTRP